MKLVPRAIRLMRPSLFEFLKTQEDFDECIYKSINSSICRSNEMGV